MARVSGGELAGAVAAAGGLGMIGVGGSTDAEFIAREGAIASGRGRFGFGLMCWALEARPELLDAVLDAKPHVVALSFGDPAPWVERVHAAGARTVSQVQDAESARLALDAGVDAVVAQGTEAGGHTGGVSTLPLLQIVLELAADRHVPVLAAGGIATGRGVAAVLAAGAQGAWIGTLFAATREAMRDDAAKQRLVAARETDTVLTRVYDVAQDIPWPERFPGRALRTEFTDRWHGREGHLAAEREAASGSMGEYDYAGQGVGAIHGIEPAGDVVEHLAREAEWALAEAYRQTSG
ncbi:MAG: NAD(P)H-dependent flavin oxidoreductase [Gaiellaceae bacterium]